MYLDIHTFTDIHTVSAPATHRRTRVLYFIIYSSIYTRPDTERDEGRTHTHGRSLGVPGVQFRALGGWHTGREGRGRGGDASSLDRRRAGARAHTYIFTIGGLPRSDRALRLRRRITHVAERASQNKDKQQFPLSVLVLQ